MSVEPLEPVRPVDAEVGTLRLYVVSKDAMKACFAAGWNGCVNAYDGVTGQTFEEWFDANCTKVVPESETEIGPEPEVVP